MPTTVISMSETEKVFSVESLASNDDSAYLKPSPPALTTEKPTMMTKVYGREKCSSHHE
jgi:hypothetical protein